MTQEEILLWEKLKGKQVLNLRFRRQHPINVYIADFYCHKAKLAIELDGKIHLKSKENDKERTKIIEDFGIKVIRFTNEDVKMNIKNVVSEIEEILIERLDS